MFESVVLPVFPWAVWQHPSGARAREREMRGIRGEPVEVWLRSGRPARFVWRGRMHTVIFVLDRQLRPAVTPADPDTPADAAASDSTTSGPHTSGTGGSECWRVEATPERSVPPATYELCRDLASGRWLLSRA